MGGVEVNGLLGLLHLVLVIWAILNVAQARDSTIVKVVWIVFVIVLPLIGFVVWLFFGPRAHERRVRRGH